MPFRDVEREQIEKSARFLEERGYKIIEDQYSIEYCLNGICIRIVCPPNSDESEINIYFRDKNRVFDIGWIALVREDMQGYNDKMNNIVNLLNYIKANYSKIIDYKFCIESDELIEQYINSHRLKYEDAVSKFLSRNT